MVVALLLILSCSIFFGVSACEAGGKDGTNHIDINLDEMDVGEKVYFGDLVFEKAPENAPIPPSTRATTEGFTVTDFGGNTSMDKVLALTIHTDISEFS